MAGRTYLVRIDVFADEFVTILENGDLALEDAVTGDYLVVERDHLDAYAGSDPPYTEHVADRIRGELLSNAHDACGWDFMQNWGGGWWYRIGRCPTCGEW